MANERVFPYKVPLLLHKQNRDKVTKAMEVTDSAVALLQAGTTLFRYDTDREELFRQESHFQYLFGVEEPDVYGLIELASGKTHLFFPKLPDEYAVWLGEIKTQSYFKTKYEVDEVHWVPDLVAFLEKLAPSAVHVMSGVNSDSGSKVKPASFEGQDKFNIVTDKLYDVVCESRVHKNEEEIKLMKFVAGISSEAHCAVMQEIKPGMAEFELEARFLQYVYAKGACRFTAYTCICGAGHNAATLHYPNNDKRISEDQMMLLDMGAEYHCYTSDITCSYPANGKFTEKQKGIYNAVLASNVAVFKAAKAGVNWLDMHELAYKVIVEHLLNLGLLHNGTVDEIVAAEVGALFMPHGLGHLMGLDCHDVGGYLTGTPERSTRPGFRSVRTARDLEDGMVLTIEPGLYFIPPLLEPAFKSETQSKYLNESKIREYFGFGGVRIEDDVLITKTGCELLNDVPRSVEAIEACMAGKEWRGL